MGKYNRKIVEEIRQGKVNLFWVSFGKLRDRVNLSNASGSRENLASHILDIIRRNYDLSYARQIRERSWL